MVKAVSAYQNGLTRVYTNDDGSVTVLRDGSRAWRNNNPGNIKYGANARAAGAIGKDNNGFAIFPDYQSGLQGIANVFTRKYGNSTIDQAMQGYAPPSENDTAGYIASLKNRGVPGNTLIKDFTPDQLNRLGDGIRSHEGWHPGTATGPATNMGGPGSPVGTPGAVNQANPFQNAGVPIPDFAQTQAVEPAFGATSWPPRPALPNMFPPDLASPSAGAPGVAPVPFTNGTIRAQQALDNSRPTPGASSSTFSDRFGRWDNFGGVSGPTISGGSNGLGQTGDGDDFRADSARFAQQSVDPSSPSQTSPSLAAPSDDTTSSVRRLGSRILGAIAVDQGPTLGQDEAPLRSAGVPRAPSPPTPSLPAPRAFDVGTTPISYAPPPAPDAPGGLLGRLMQMNAFDPSDPDQPPAGGLLALIQQYMRNNPDGSATH